MKRSSVLVELVLDVLFLALALVVLLRLFSAAHQTSLASEQKARASLEMQSVLDRCKLDPPSADETRRYDADFLPVDGTDAAARIDIAVSDEAVGTGTVRTFVLTAFADGEEVATLTGGCYLPGEVTP